MYTLGLLAIFILVQFVIAIGIVAAIQLGLTDQGTLSEPAVILFYNSVVYGLVLAVVIGLTRWIAKRAITLKEVGLDRLIQWRDIGLSTAAFIPYLIISQLLLALATSVLPWVDINQKQDIGFSTNLYGLELTLAFVALVVLAPLAEEVLFRGYLYGKLRRYSGMIISSLVVSLAFGVLHGAWNVGIDVFALSVVACLLREVTGSVWAGVLLHAMKNGLAFYVLFINPSLLSTIGG